MSSNYLSSHVDAARQGQILEIVSRSPKKRTQISRANSLLSSTDASSNAISFIPHMQSQSKLDRMLSKYVLAGSVQNNDGRIRRSSSAASSLIQNVKAKVPLPQANSSNQLTRLSSIGNRSSFKRVTRRRPPKSSGWPTRAHSLERSTDRRGFYDNPEPTRDRPGTLGSSTATLDRRSLFDRSAHGAPPPGRCHRSAAAGRDAGRQCTASLYSVVEVTGGGVTFKNKLESDKILRHVYDLLCSERDYVAALHAVFDVYVEPLRKFSSLSSDDMRMLFGGLEPILQLSIQLCKYLKEQLESWNCDTSSVGFLFPDKFWREYYQYHSSYHLQRIDRYLDVARSTNTEFGEFCRLRSGLTKHSIDESLLLPVRRVKIYRDWLVDLRAIIGSAHRDFDVVTRSSQRADTMVEEIQRHAEGIENERHVERIQERFPYDDLHLEDKWPRISTGNWKKLVVGSLLLRGLGGRKHAVSSAKRDHDGGGGGGGGGGEGGGGGVSHNEESVISNGSLGSCGEVGSGGGGNGVGGGSMERVFVCEGPVKLTTGLQTQERYMFLFSDLLLLAKERTLNQFRLKMKILVTNLWIANCVDDVSEVVRFPERSFVIGWPTTNLVATFESSEERDYWLNHLKRCLSLEKEKVMPKSVPIRIVNNDSSYTVTKRLNVGPSEEASQVVHRCLQEFHESVHDPRECQLWVLSARDDPPYPLIGHEHPYSIFMSHRQLFGQVKSMSTLNVETNDVVFIFRESCKLTPRRSLIRQHGRLKVGHRLPIKSLFRHPPKASSHPLPPPRPHSVPDTLERASSTADDTSGSRELAGSGLLFGVDLNDLIERNDLPQPIMRILYSLWLNGPHTVGVFRKSANCQKYRLARERLDSGHELDCDEQSTILLAALLKSLLRSLPNCLLTCERYDRWLEAAQLATLSQCRKAMRRLVDELPSTHTTLLRHVIFVLHRTSLSSDINGMTSQSLSICVGPSLLWPLPSLGAGNQTNHIEMTHQRDDLDKVNRVVEILIENAEEIFGTNCAELFEAPLTMSDTAVSVAKTMKGDDRDLESFHSLGSDNVICGGGESSQDSESLFFNSLHRDSIHNLLATDSDNQSMTKSDDDALSLTDNTRYPSPILAYGFPKRSKVDYVSKNKRESKLDDAFSRNKKKQILSDEIIPENDRADMSDGNTLLLDNVAIKESSGNVCDTDVNTLTGAVVDSVSESNDMCTSCEEAAMAVVVDMPCKYTNLYGTDSVVQKKKKFGRADSFFVGEVEVANDRDCVFKYPVIPASKMVPVEETLYVPATSPTPSAAAASYDSGIIAHYVTTSDDMEDSAIAKDDDEVLSYDDENGSSLERDTKHFAIVENFTDKTWEPLARGRNSKSDAKYSGETENYADKIVASSEKGRIPKSGYKARDASSDDRNSERSEERISMLRSVKELSSGYVVTTISSNSTKAPVFKDLSHTSDTINRAAKTTISDYESDARPAPNTIRVLHHDTALDSKITSMFRDKRGMTSRGADVFPTSRILAHHPVIKTLSVDDQDLDIDDDSGLKPLQIRSHTIERSHRMRESISREHSRASSSARVEKSTSEGDLCSTVSVVTKKASVALKQGNFNGANRNVVSRSMPMMPPPPSYDEALVHKALQSTGLGSQEKNKTVLGRMVNNNSLGLSYNDKLSAASKALECRIHEMKDGQKIECNNDTIILNLPGKSVFTLTPTLLPGQTHASSFLTEPQVHDSNITSPNLHTACHQRIVAQKEPLHREKINFTTPLVHPRGDHAKNQTKLAQNGSSPAERMLIPVTTQFPFSKLPPAYDQACSMLEMPPPSITTVSTSQVDKSILISGVSSNSLVSIDERLVVEPSTNRNKSVMSFSCRENRYSSNERCSNTPNENPVTSTGDGKRRVLRKWSNARTRQRLSDPRLSSIGPLVESEHRLSSIKSSSLARSKSDSSTVPRRYVRKKRQHIPGGGDNDNYDDDDDSNSENIRFSKTVAAVAVEATSEITQVAGASLRSSAMGDVSNIGSLCGTDDNKASTDLNNLPPSVSVSIPCPIPFPADNYTSIETISTSESIASGISALRNRTNLRSVSTESKSTVITVKNRNWHKELAQQYTNQSQQAVPSVSTTLQRLSDSSSDKTSPHQKRVTKSSAFDRNSNCSRASAAAPTKTGFNRFLPAHSFDEFSHKEGAVSSESMSVRRDCLLKDGVSWSVAKLRKCYSEDEHIDLGGSDGK